VTRRTVDPEGEIEALYADAVALAGERRYDEAIGVFRRMLQRVALLGAAPARRRWARPDPGVSPAVGLLRDVHIGLGSCYAEKGMLREAALELSAGLEQDAQDAEALGRLAEVWVRMGQVDAARQVLELAARADPSSAQVKLAAGHVSFALGDYEKALHAWVEALPALPAEDMRFAEFSTAFLERERPDAAVCISRAAVDAAPDEVRRWLHLARVLHSLGRFAEVREVMTRAASVFPDQLDVLLALAQAMLALGDSDAAGEVCTRLRALAPTNPSVLMLSAAAAQRRGRTAEALEHAADLVRASPLDPYAHFQLGALQQETGSLVEAMQRYSIALSLAASSDEDLVAAISEAMQRLDMVQIQQVVTLAAENVVFRTRLRRDPERTLHDYGFRLTEAALMMLQSVDVSDLPQMLGRRDRRMSH
jgi:tetratricopeptide (TPR) repeat protein